LSAPSPALVPILTRWLPLRISSRLIERALVVETMQPAIRVPARPALFARAAAARVPLVVTAPDSAPILAYDVLAGGITEAIAR
jgi:hypothetical protein